jgi:hypothetical protein
MIPDEFIGVWQRVSIALGDGPAEEPAQVFWLQGRSAYADIRVPADGTANGLDCFAGHTTWEPPYLRWSHDIDLAGGPAATVDTGRIEWDGDDLVETGVFTIDGADVPYVEVWRKQSDVSSQVVEVTDAGFTRVEIGEHALTVLDERPDGGHLSARYQRDGEVVLAISDEVVLWTRNDGLGGRK